MADDAQNAGSISGGRESSALNRGPRRWLAFGALLALAGAAAVSWSCRPSGPAEMPLTGQLHVAIRPAGAPDVLAIDEAGALPARAGASMSLQVNFNQPAYAYFIWLDCHGHAVPLYPWNYDDVEVKDANQPPPPRRAAQVIITPTLGKGWVFDRAGGLDTVLLLARRAPLGEATKLGLSLEALATPPMRQPDELGILALDRGSDSFSALQARHRGTEEEAQEVDRPLLERLMGLRDQFELIRVVRFAHDGS